MLLSFGEFVFTPLVFLSNQWVKTQLSLLMKQGVVIDEGVFWPNHGRHFLYYCYTGGVDTVYREC